MTRLGPNNSRDPFRKSGPRRNDAVRCPTVSHFFGVRTDGNKFGASVAVRVLAAPHFAIDSQKQNSPNYVATYFLNSDMPIGGSRLLKPLRPTISTRRRLPRTQMTFRCSSLPELEVPMINTMVTCLGSERRRLNYTTLQLAFAATRLASDPGAVTANQLVLPKVWGRRDTALRSMVAFAKSKTVWCTLWGEAHHTVSGTLLDTLKNEREEMRKQRVLSVRCRRLQIVYRKSAGERNGFAQILLALAGTLDSHVQPL